jgi:hypothetical protein
MVEITPELIAAVDESTDMKSLTDVYLKCRSLREELKRAYTDADKPVKDFMDHMEAKMLSILDSQKLESVTTSHGTVYRSTQTRAKVADWKVFVAYIKKNDAFDLLKKDVSKDAVKARIEDSGEVVPGVDIYSFHVANVRKS